MSTPSIRTVGAVLVTAYGDPPTTAYGPVVLPTCPPEAVVIAVHAAGVHFADALMLRGEYQVRPDLPFSPGMEVAGEVVEVGENVTSVEVGQRVLAVMTGGAMSEAVVVPASQVARIPSGISYEAAAGFALSHLTAHAALHFRAALQPGETVLVTGSSGDVGRAVIRVARAAGAVVLAASREYRAKDTFEDDAGIVVIDSDSSTLVDEVKRHTAGRGADVVIDVVGGDVLSQLIRATAWEGRVVVVGFAGGPPAPVKPGHLLVKNIGILGLQSTDYWVRAPGRIRAALDDLMSFVAAGALPVEDPCAFPVGEIEAALAAVAENPGTPVVVSLPGNVEAPSASGRPAPH